MPYIKLADRVRFKTPIEDVLGILKDPNDTLYIKGEYFGYFVNRVAKRFLADPDYTQSSFNSAFFNDAKKKTLSNAADSIAAMINRSDPIASAGELNFAITAVLWGCLGQAEGFSEAGYGLRTYFRAIIEKVLDSVNTVNTGSQKDMAMAFRRHLAIRGVLGDVVSETYRRFTAPYEDGKLSRDDGNGNFFRLANDVWVNGNLNVPMENQPKALEAK